MFSLRALSSQNGEAISCEILRELITVVMLSRKIWLNGLKEKSKQTMTL